MSAQRALEVVARLDAAGVEAWLDGGWGIEALIGVEHRLHGDLDLIVVLGDTDRALRVLANLGYTLVLDRRPTRLVAEGPRGRRVDMHPVTFDASGTGWQAGAGAARGDAAHPAAGFAHGSVAGQRVGCLSPELQLAHHRGYIPEAVDVSDVAILCGRFALPYPPEYPRLYEDGDGPEEILPGGNLAPCVRAGDTVRRAIGPWTPDTHALLAHLHAVGFVAAPRVLGIDGKGREVLSFHEGPVGWPTISPDMASDASLVAMARLVRRYHQATIDFERRADAKWLRMPGAPVDGEIICHNDLAPSNTVYEAGEPAVLLDWDLAAPGSRLWDVATVAWRFVPLSDDDYAAAMGWPTQPDRRARLRLLCDEYGLDADERAGMLHALEQTKRAAYEAIRLWGEEGLPGWKAIWETGHAEGPERDLAFLDAHREEWRTWLR